jgi:hypothetical protein
MDDLEKEKIMSSTSLPLRLDTCPLCLMPNHYIMPLFSFPIPSSLQDLEREPYNLEPYPRDFDDRGDEASRADSFQSLVQSLQQGNRNLRAAGGAAFTYQQEQESQSQNNHDNEVDDEDDAWMDRERVQNLYTLVRYVLLLFLFLPSIFFASHLSSYKTQRTSHITFCCYCCC